MDQCGQALRVHPISPSALESSLSFQTRLIGCKDPDGGGIADRPGDMVDVFHTLFGVAGAFFSWVFFDAF